MKSRFFRMKIIGVDRLKLEAIKTWFESKIETNDYEDKLGWGANVLENSEGNFELVADMYIKIAVAMDKYRDIIKNKFQTYDKTGLISAKVIQYDDCDHGSDIHSPCEPTVRMEWTV